MKRTSAAIALLPLLFAVARAGADAAPPHFHFERSVVPAAAGPNRLPVDVSLLVGARPVRTAGDRASGGLEDLRFFDVGGREVPYLRIDPTPPAERWQPGSILAIAATEEASGFEVDLGRAMRIDRMRLAGIPVPFLKRFRLEGSGDRARWSVLVDDGTLFDLPEDRLARRDVDFPAGELRYLRITWDDRSSAVVPLPTQAAVRIAEPGVESAPQMIPLTFERRPSEPGKSRFRIHLPGAKLPVVALELEVGGDHLLRVAEVTEPRLGGDALAPVGLGAHLLRRATRGALSAGDLRVPIARPQGADLDLVVSDGDNPPLDLTAVRAELARLPWIYLEPSAAETIVARYGDEQLGPPRYDLEAARAAIDESRLVEAKWGEARALDVPPPPPEAPLALPSAVGATIDREPFRYARSIPAGGGGLVALALDAAVLAHSRGLADVRVADRDGRQVPYLIERLPEPLKIALPALEPLPAAARAEHTSRYRLKLPFEGLPAARLVLRTDARVFTRGVSLIVERPPDDPRSQPAREKVAVRTWSHTDAENPASALVLELPPLGTAVAEVAVDEGDNSPLPLAPPEMLLPAARLRFYRPDGADLELLYGAPEVSVPRYDLQILAAKVLASTAAEIVPAAERSTGVIEAGERAQVKQKSLFWGALIVAVLVLVALIARLVSRGGHQEDARSGT